MTTDMALSIAGESLKYLRLLNPFVSRAGIIHSSWLYSISSSEKSTAFQGSGDDAPPVFFFLATGDDPVS